ncbi:tRNA pseudouridine synthase D [Nitzschia inconspicua]|uniref:tRNA pseudouridine synthase D n=1 Tax=Nitzschia inconspicua TaxID=303405 RepID=A0A9K3KWD0_9STRA|nr:tRNA pseudouridine synthase D [Nitzschia inconspicua]
MEDFCFYSTIGIEGFVVGPSHPLPSEYLKKDEDLSSSSSLPSTGETYTTESCTFTSWEILGTIKDTPEDFVVREVLPRKFTIPGISPQDNERLRVAHIPDRVPPQNFTQNHAVPTSSTSPNRTVTDAAPGLLEPNILDATTTKPLNESKVPDATSTSNLDIIQDYLRTVAGDDHEKAVALQEALQRLQDCAMNQMHTAATAATLDHNEELSSKRDKHEQDLWIPPFPTSSSNQVDEPSTVLAKKSARGAFHKAVRLEYPCLQTESGVWGKIESKSNDNKHRKDDVQKSKFEEHGIRVFIDNSFNELVPFLSHPKEDMIKLLAFRNRGFEGARGSNGSTARNAPKGSGPEDNNWIPSDPTSAALRLRSDLSKDDRRRLHQLVAAKNKYFDTTTTQIHDNDSDNSEHASVLVVRWQRHALMRGLSKQKRKRQDVEESSSGESDGKFCNLLCVMKKYQKEHLTAMQKLTQILKCRQTDIGSAGIKDLQAVTYQFITLRNMKRTRVEKANDQHLSRYGITLDLFYNVDFVLSTGLLEGNKFEIILRDLRQVRVDKPDTSFPAKESIIDCDWDHLRAMTERVRTNGFINFYGEQRVGAPGLLSVVGNRTFDIGRAMLQKDYLKAIHLLMEGTSTRESKDVQKVRQAWKDSNGDTSETLKALQGSDIMPREKAVLRGLHRFPDNPLEALRSLNHNMRLFYVNAYQSYLWNLAASKRIALHGNQVALGDLYFESANDDRSMVKVVHSTEELATVGISQVVLPLPGFNVQYPENEVGSFYKEILDRDGIKFEKNEIPESTAKGSYRHLLVFPKDMCLEEIEGQKDYAKISFQLPKGCYATMLLREMMLTTVTRPAQA